MEREIFKSSFLAGFNIGMWFCFAAYLFFTVKNAEVA